MNKIKRAIENRQFHNKSHPLKVFESRLKAMMELEGSIVSSKLSEVIKNEARKQYLTMLVTSFENYNREIFRKLIDDKLIPLEKIFKLKKLKKLKFNSEEVKYVKENNVKLSELASEYINFQNLDEVLSIFSIINIKKEMKELIENKDNKMPSFEEATTEVINKKVEEIIEKEGGITPEKINQFFGAAEVTNEFFKQIVLHKKVLTLELLFPKIDELLYIRNKIIHQNADIDIKQEDIFFLTSCIYNFVVNLDILVDSISKR